MSEAAEPKGKRESTPRIFTPFQLNDMVDQALADNVGTLWIEGELSDVVERNGHAYFALKDERASVRGLMYANDLRRVRHLFVDGQSVRLKVVVGIYVPRGAFQIRALLAFAAGAGDRAAEVARMRAKLAAEGLFDPTKKRALPAWPRVVGIVTSRAGAALHDIGEVARTRMPSRLVFVHASVQGVEAPSEIMHALGRLQKVPDLDVIILARGGGASDDLSAFDDERLARAVARCPVPVVTGVGHETDVTTVDLVADVRAATPSHAAELAIPARVSFLHQLSLTEARAERAVRARLSAQARRLGLSKERIVHPGRRLARLASQLGELLARLRQAMTRELAGRSRALDALRARLTESEPQRRLLRTGAQCVELEGRIRRAMQARLDGERRKIEETRTALERAVRLSPQRGATALGRRAAQLEALSPLGVLGRGYAIALHERSGRALLDPREAEVGDRLSLRLARGTLEAEVTGRGEESQT